MRRLLAVFLILVGLGPVVLLGADAGTKNSGWPQWRGPDRNGICAETGLLKEWPKNGPKLLWDSNKVNNGKSVGTGYSSLAIVDDKIFTQGDRKFDDKGPAGYAFCLDASTGKEIWRTKIGAAQGDGPQSTPTVDGDRVYPLTRQGNLACLKVSDGAILWQKDFSKDFGGHSMSSWDYSESALVDGDKLICTPGGKEAGLVALNKKTGEVIWKCTLPKDSGAGYASVVVSKGGGIRQYVTLLGHELGLVGVDAETGKFLWNYKKVGNGTANIPTAIVKDDYVFTSTGYGTGAALLQLVSKNGSIEPKEIYFLKGDKLQNHHGGMVMLGNYIYGGHGHNEGLPFCLEWKTGKFAWEPHEGPGGGSAAVLYADGQLYFRYENGEMALIQATPDSYKLVSSFHVPIKGNGWPHPVIYKGKLYLRGADQILCYDIKG
jgi:outer membrane protein assembly factor BamB